MDRASLLIMAKKTRRKIREFIENSKPFGPFSDHSLPKVDKETSH